MIKHIMHPFSRKSGGDTSNKVGVAKYTCPMHPEVQSSAPGSCPKCGMFLSEVNDESINETTEKGDTHDKPAQKHGCC